MSTSDADNIFQLSELGFKVISISIIVAIILGLIALFIFFRVLDGKKVMLFGLQFIVLGFVFNAIADFRMYYPSLSFITIFIGIIVSTIGLCKRD